MTEHDAMQARIERYRRVLEALAVQAEASANELHRLACSTDGEAGRALSTKWRQIHDALTPALALLSGDGPAPCKHEWIYTGEVAFGTHGFRSTYVCKRCAEKRSV